MTDRPLSPVPQDVLDRALHQMRALLRGNGATADAVTLQSFEGGVLDFEAYQVFHVTPQVTEKTVNGKQKGKILTSETELHHEVQDSIEHAGTDGMVKAVILDHMRKRADLGFGLDDYTIPLTGANTDYVVHSQCGTCHGSKAGPCARCTGSGREICMRCRGKRDITCPACRGNGTQMHGGEQMQCRQCHGRRTVACTLCRRTGQMPCTGCKGMGKAPCQNCGSTGWRSLIASVVFSARGHFEYDRAALPDLIPGQIDRVKARMVADRHAAIRLIEDSARLSELEKRAQQGLVIVPYRVQLPYGKISFSIRGHGVSGRLFGLRPVLFRLPPFLEKTAAGGLRRLTAAAQNKGNVATALGQAAKTRLVADILAAAATNNPVNAVKHIRRHYPHGLRADTIPPLIDSANICLRRLFRRPRLTGFIVSLILCLALNGVWLFGPVRAEFFTGKAPAFLMAADMALLFIGGALSVSIIVFTCTRAMNIALGRRKKSTPPIKPKMADNVVIGSGTALFVFIVMLHGAFIGGHAPFWYADLMHMIGL